MKKCVKCKLDKLEADFYRQPKSKDGLFNSCKDCIREQQIEYRKSESYKKNRPKYRKRYYQENKTTSINQSKDFVRKNPEYYRLKYAKEKYGLTPEEYYALHSHAKCFICETTKASRHKNRRFCIDHCHKTGVVRGLLCMDCNIALGHFKDNIENLERAIEYLKTTNVDK